MNQYLIELSTYMSSKVEVRVVGEVDGGPPGGEGLVLDDQGVVLSERVSDGNVDLTRVTFFTVCARVLQHQPVLLHPA